MQDKSEQLKRINERLESSIEKFLNTEAKLIDVKRSIQFADIIQQFSSFYYRVQYDTEILEGMLQGVNNLFLKIVGYAKTGWDFYKVAELVSENPQDSLKKLSIGYYQQAAAKKNIFSLCVVAEKAFAGVFFPLEDSLRWALNCLRFLEKYVIPKFDNDRAGALAAFYENRLQQLRTMADISSQIPESGEQFEALLTLLIKRKAECKGGTPFILATNMERFFTNLQIEYRIPEKSLSETLPPRVQGKVLPALNINSKASPLQEEAALPPIFLATLQQQDTEGEDYDKAELTEEDKCITQFFAEHNQNLNSNWFFSHTNLKPGSNLYEILLHAKEKGRTYDICIKLNWLKSDGTLDLKAPEPVKDAYQQVNTSGPVLR